MVDIIQDILNRVKGIANAILGLQIAGKLPYIANTVLDIQNTLKNFQFPEFNLGNIDWVQTIIDSIPGEWKKIFQFVFTGIWGMVVETFQNEYEMGVNVSKGMYNDWTEPIKKNDDRLSWYLNVCDFSQTSNVKNIHFYEFIKIRIALESIFKTHGYPVKAFHGIAFNSGLAVWIPENYEIDFYNTYLDWIKHESHRFRNFQLRYQASSRMQLLLSAIPIVRAESLFEFVSNEVPIMWRFFENCAFYNTLHDVAIVANWDEILNVLNEAGY